MVFIGWLVSERTNVREKDYPKDGFLSAMSHKATLRSKLPVTV